MRVLKNILYDVPGGWWFFCEETDFKVVPPPGKNTYRGLVSCVAEHLIVNKIDIPKNLDKIIQNQISQRVPQELSKEIE